MTKKELSQLYWLRQELQDDKRRLAELIDQQQYEDNVKIKAEIANLRAIIETRHQLCLYERNRLEQYISEIEDSTTRLIFKYRFVDNLEWAQISTKMRGLSPDSLRMTVNRYIKRTR